MVLCDDGSYYIGVTRDVELRVAQHNAGEFDDCYTNDAICWEKQIKKWSGAKKAALARGDFETLRRLSRGGGSAGPATGSSAG